MNHERTWKAALTAAALMVSFLLGGYMGAGGADVPPVPNAPPAAPVSSDGLYASRPRVKDSPQWVKNLASAKDPEVSQLFVIAGMGMNKTTAAVAMHERDADGNWKQILSTPGYVGRNGLCKAAGRKEGCGRTPIGVFRFNKAFGIAPDPGCAMPYVQVDEYTYWSGNPNLRYNEMVDIRDYPNLDTTQAEHLIDYDVDYQYCLNIGFNPEGTPGRGSAIFLHCLGPIKPYTAGCVAIPENMMKLVLQHVRPGCVVVINTLSGLNGRL